MSEEETQNGDSKRVGRPPHLMINTMRQIYVDWVAHKEPDERLPTELALAERYKVSRDTVRSVLQEMERRRWIVRKAARGAFVADHFHRTQNVGKQIALLYPTGDFGISESFTAAVINGINQIQSKTGINLTLLTRLWKWVDVNEERPERHFEPASVLGGYILSKPYGEVTDRANSVGKPMVAIDFDGTERGMDSFCFDNEAAGELLGRRLHKLGHRRIVAVVEDPEKSTAREQDPAWQERREGFLKELQKLEAPTPTLLLLRTRGNYDEAYDEIRKMLERPASERPTAIFLPHCGDISGLEKIVNDLGLRIPKDLTVVGFGNTGDPSDMTSIRFDGLELGTAAAEHMMRMITDPQMLKHKPGMYRYKGRYFAGKTHAQAPGTE